MKVRDIHIHTLIIQTGQTSQSINLELLMSTLAQHTELLNGITADLETIAVQIGLIVERNAEQTSPEADAAAATLRARVDLMKTVVADELAKTGG